MTGVWSNSAPTGGYGAFDDRSTIATWLQDAGYHTALIGKYLNWYRQAALAGKVPPGWDRWVAFAENNGKHTDYDLTVNGRIEPHHGDPVKDFSTDVLTSRAVSFIHQTEGPLFLYFAPFAPHGPYDDVPARDQCPALKPYDVGFLRRGGRLGQASVRLGTPRGGTEPGTRPMWSEPVSARSSPAWTARS